MLLCFYLQRKNDKRRGICGIEISKALWDWILENVGSIHRITNIESAMYNTSHLFAVIHPLQPYPISKDEFFILLDKYKTDSLYHDLPPEEERRPGYRVFDGLFTYEDLFDDNNKDKALKVLADTIETVDWDSDIVSFALPLVDD